MEASKKRQYEITVGPSKFDLMLALFDSKHPNFRIVRFRGSLRTKDFIEARYMDVRVLNCGFEDGSGESWLLELEGKVEGVIGSVRLKGWYRTDRRTGYLTES